MRGAAALTACEKLCYRFGAKVRHRPSRLNGGRSVGRSNPEPPSLPQHGAGLSGLSGMRGQVNELEAAPDNTGGST